MHILTKPFASFCGRCLLQACNLLFHLIHSCCYGRKRIQAFSLALPWSTCGNEDPPAPSDSSLPLLLLLLLQAALGAGVSRAVYRVSSSQPLEVPLSGLSDVSPFWEKKQTAVSRGWGYSRWGWIALGLLCVTVCVCYQKKNKTHQQNPLERWILVPFWWVLASQKHFLVWSTELANIAVFSWQNWLVACLCPAISYLLDG